LSAVRRVTVVGQNPLQLQIQTNSKVAPQTQVISAPDRLVIDIPNSVQGTTLRGIAVNREGVKGVRVGQFSAMPPVTRIVVDLTAPQTYKVVPNAAGLLVSLGTEPATATSANSQASPIIGWVSGKSTVKVISAVASPSAGQNLLHPALAANSVRVQFTDGLLSIQATGATLSQVLFEIQKQTGAEIAIPAGAEQDRVAANFGPGPAGQVLGELLNGSGLNFVVVGSESDPRVLRSVLLSPKSDQPGGAVAQPYSAPEAQDIPPQGQEDLTPPDSSPVPPDDNSPPQQAVPAPADAGAAAPPQ
jgi:hypothetical protein